MPTATELKTETKQCTLTGVWHNQHGSEIDLAVQDDGRVTGCLKLRPIPGKEGEQFTLSGFTKDEIVTFCVDFGVHYAMTAWVGQFSGSNCFETMWQTVADTHGHPEKKWRAILTGSDTFKRGACPESLLESLRPASHPMYSGII